MDYQLYDVDVIGRSVDGFKNAAGSHVLVRQYQKKLMKDSCVGEARAVNYHIQHHKETMVEAHNLMEEKEVQSELPPFFAADDALELKFHEYGREHARAVAEGALEEAVELERGAAEEVVTLEHVPILDLEL